MSILLFIVGAIAFAAGAAMVGYGIPINEFSFGNTLIISGTTAIVGGLIVIGLGIATLYLRRIADALVLRPAARANRPAEAFEAMPNPARPPVNPARVPFPPKKPIAARIDAVPPMAPMAPIAPMAEPLSEPSSPEAESPVARRANYLAPTLANPDEVAAEAEQEVSLSPQHPAPPPAPAEPPAGRRPPPFFRRNEPEPEADAADEEPSSFEPRHEASSPAAPPPRKAPTTYFDTMWPLRSKPEPEEANATDAKPVEDKPLEDDTVELGREDSDWDDARTPSGAPVAEVLPESEPVSEHAAHASAKEPEEAAPPVAILKSGVVDGMGYTLYVDGSIEAELPQGTLRFASINELRSHLERTS